MTDFINNFRTIHHFVKGILSNGKGEYTLTFVQDPDDRWYIDMPWDGNRANLEMVAGADDLLTFLDIDGRHRVTIHVVPSETPIEVEGHTELRQLDKSLTGGSHYDATDFRGFRMSRIWICPVTLCVLGRYPKYLYVRDTRLVRPLGSKSAIQVGDLMIVPKPQVSTWGWPCRIPVASERRFVEEDAGRLEIE